MKWITYHFERPTGERDLMRVIEEGDDLKWLEWRELLWTKEWPSRAIL